MGSEEITIPPLTKVALAHRVQLSEQVVVDSCDDGFEVSVQNMVFDVSEVSDNEADVPSPCGQDSNGVAPGYMSSA